MDKFEARLRTCDGAFFPFHSQTASGEMELDLGVKGILYLEIEATGGPAGGPTRSEIHGSFEALVDSPVWRLVQALATLTTPDGNTIAMPGYYDPVRPRRARPIEGGPGGRSRGFRGAPGLSARGGSARRAAAVRGGDGEMGSDPIFVGS